MKTKFYACMMIALSLCAYSSVALAQGCVAVKNMSTCHLHVDSITANQLQLSLNYRYFRSYKHFVGNHEERHRVDQGTEVINNDNSINLGINYAINSKWSIGVTIPYVFIDRSSMYEHLGNAFPGQTPPNANNPKYERFHTQTQGLGDIRLMGYYTLYARSNDRLAIGLGMKFPTGKYDAMDEFHKPNGIVSAVVDQSMQPGDGGWGNIIEFDYSLSISKNLGAYASGMYMVNPANTNGVVRSPNLVKTSGGEDIPLSNEFSVTDQYMIRMGARYEQKNLQVLLGGRMECIPSKDLIGESDGFRRPGYIISLEPSVLYTFKQHTVGLSFPLAMERNRTRSQIDKARGINPNTSKPFHGDAAFADWLLSVTYAYRISL